MCDDHKEPSKAEIQATMREMFQNKRVRLLTKEEGGGLYPHQQVALKSLRACTEKSWSPMNAIKKMIEDGHVFIGVNKIRSSGTDTILYAAQYDHRTKKISFEDAADRLLDESHVLKNSIVQQDKDIEGDTIMDILRKALPVGAVQLGPDCYYVPLEWSVEEAQQHLSALPTNRDDDDEELVDIGGNKKMSRKDLRKIIHGINSAGGSGVSAGANATSFSVSSHAQSTGRLKRADDMSDDELVKELTPRQKPTAEEIDAIEYPMPGHLWTNSELSINAAVLKATTRCLWVKVELSPDCPEVHVMNREQFRCFLTHHGDHEDWKTRRPNWRDPQTSDDVLRYNLTTTTYSGVDELLQHMIEHEFPYIEHTPV